MKELDLNHIGIAVRSIEEKRAFYRALGLEFIKEEVVQSENVKVAFLPLASGGQLELLEPTHADSAVAKFLDKRGEGVHHFCLNVKDLNATLQQLKTQGIKLIDEKPRVGAFGTRVAFIHPKSAGGVLIELCEHQEEG